MNKIDWRDIVIWILVIISAIVIFWYVFGDSPTFEQALLIFILTAIFSMVINISKIATRLDFLESRFNKSQGNIRDGFNKIKKDTDLIKNKLKI